MSKRIRVSQITVPLNHDLKQVKKKACRIAGIKESDVLHFEIVKQSVDARHKEDVKYNYSAEMVLKSGVRYKKNPRHIREVERIKYQPQITGCTPMKDSIVVIGSGPAGLFCAYLLAKYGYRPLVLERGKCIEERQKDVEKFWEKGILSEESNVQFGEGGAGTFSDGKLNTLVKDKIGRNRFVLETFVSCGAPKDILYVNKPHIGTDILRTVVSNMRNEIIRMGGSFSFSSKVTDFETECGHLSALIINGETRIPAGAAVLAIGHSARDTFSMLKERAVFMEPKSFAIGFRVEHPQEMIDISQYGTAADRSLLPPSPYKLTHQASNGRSVYSFCMCPGGYVVNASSEEGRLAVNGMSYHARDSRNANSAVIVSVTPEDFPDSADPLSGVTFQRTLEEKAWMAGNGKIPQQKFGEFESCSYVHGSDVISSCTRGAAAKADLRSILPDEANAAFIEGMHAFGKKIAGFDRPDAILSAVESRTSSPVRIRRDESFQSNIRGLYPCGEGAGYAGGITSAAMDGLKVAEAIMCRYSPPVS